jgi:gliding motility-associated-like protein
MFADTLCEGTSIVLQPVSNATSYTWSGTPLTLNNTAGSSVTVSPTVPTQYTFTGNFGRCTYNDTVNIFVHTAPIPDAGADGAICYGQDFQLGAAPGRVAYEWSPAKYLAGNTDSFDPDVIRPDATITYNLHVTDGNGCRSLVSDAVTIDVTPPIIVTTNPTDTVVYIGDEIQVTAFSAGTDYVWSPAYGLSDPNGKSPMITVDKDITYTIEATTAAGCQGNTTLTIKAYKGPEIYVPTGFTPNKDGHNDLLRPIPVGIKTLKYFRVFNRWGNMVYSWSGTDRGPVVFNMQSSNIGWDGTYQGKPLTTATYVWVAEGITKEGKTILRKGVCTLIR